MAGPLYARYIPEKAPTKTKASVQSIEAPEAPEAQKSAPSARPAKKEKKERERPKKRKRDKHEESEEEEASKKHKSVLSKFEKSKRVADAVREEPEQAAQAIEEEQPELHDLVPLPQPEPVPEPDYKPTFSALSPWLAHPITVTSRATTPFSTLPIDTKLVSHLNQKGYTEAFAVQSAVLPLLLPGPKHHPGDICVSAATGSGKTLAYVLPMVESMRHRVVTKLQGLVVVPTRELVAQAREIAELCSVGMGLKVGTAVGNHSFAAEQEMLVKKGRRYDPEKYKILQAKAKERILYGTAEQDAYLDDAVDMLPGHVPEYESKVDILVCTPGRLVEHIQSTTGFSLDDVQWLVIDEADRLLDQSFQEWVGVVMAALQAEKPYEEMNARDQVLSKMWYPPERRTVRKVILSATMTRDLSKLDTLRLRRPKLVVIEDAGELAGQEANLQDTLAAASGAIFELPPTLKEWAIPVGDGSDKPLYLLRLLQTHILHENEAKARARLEDSTASGSGDDDDSSSVLSDSSSDVSDTSSSSSDAASFTSSDSEHDSAASDSEVDSIPRRDPPKPSARRAIPSTNSGVLIFTSTTESATRLSRLLTYLHPPYAPLTALLTKSSATSTGRKTLSRFRSGTLRILIATDRASRGLDIPELAHIINYDIPRSVTSYVHRVGRTARAGREGEAWTLFTDVEGRWFWNAIARGEEIRRGGRKVERVKIVPAEAREGYEEALGKLKGDVEGAGR
ncbi:ATP-dependent RNA helicase dbp6 [Coniosporium apollinis]|uniref:ATP-dependent RNA helicase n=1 Tax=Coniosporium apollinis TaxID=61459 RepID=A0ABQ9NXS7_9PEZI|nr:ATP-dependent RNA helicase dbp6 [Coniosporium apollinis]